MEVKRKQSLYMENRRPYYAVSGEKNKKMTVLNKAVPLLLLLLLIGCQGIVPQVPGANFVRKIDTITANRCVFRGQHWISTTTLGFVRLRLENRASARNMILNKVISLDGNAYIQLERNSFNADIEVLFEVYKCPVNKRIIQ